MLSLEQAKENGFLTSTVEELRSYCDTLEIKWDRRHKDKALIGLLCQELGIANTANSSPESKRANLKIVSKSEVVPPYNLKPTGIWEGRRHRLRLLRPDGAKIAAGVVFRWNGKTYPVEYEVVSNIPEPIFNMIRETKRRAQKPVNVDVGEGVVERHIEFQEVGEKYPYSYIGPDPDTKDRCGSMTEWYQSKGPEWFRQRTARELGIIAKLCDIDLNNKNGDPLPVDEMMNKVVEFFFSYADAEAA